SSRCDHKFLKNVLVVNFSENGLCEPLAYKCENFASFSVGKCASCENNGCQLLGYSVQTGSNQTLAKPEVINDGYYVKTSKDDPYCVHHYQINAECETNISCDGLNLKLKSENEDEYVVTLNLLKSSIFTALLTIDSKSVKTPQKFTFASGDCVNECIRLFRKIEVNYISSTNE
ncbi:pancreatic triacylglycerol lipase-like protein, partial [Leptotrombidium deliense]